MAGSTSAAEPPAKIATRRRKNVPTPPSSASTDASTLVHSDRGFMLARPLLGKATDTDDKAVDGAADCDDGPLWPQCVAHRGYNRIWAENSIEALRSALSDDAVRAYSSKASSAGSRAAEAEVSGSAVEALARADDTGDGTRQHDDVQAGARARAADGIEFDVHLTRDKVVVVSHDASLKRCFGVDAAIDARDWRGADGIEQMKSVREPHTRMPLFADVLRLIRGLHERGERKWCMVDVKIDNPIDLMRHLGAELRAAAPKEGLAYWNDKLALGLWHHKFIAPAAEHMPGVPISHIGVDLNYSRKYWLDDDRVSGFNLQIYSLLSPWSAGGVGSAGDRFVQDCHARGKAVSVWTVNSAPLVRYAQSLGCDVVMTDDPLLMDSARQAALREVEQSPSGELFWDRSQFFAKLKTRLTVAGFQWLLWSIFVYRVYWKYS